MAGSKHLEITSMGGRKGEWYQPVHKGIRHIHGQQVLRSLCRSLPVTSHHLWGGSQQCTWTTASGKTPVLSVKAAPTATETEYGCRGPLLRPSGVFLKLTFCSFSPQQLLALPRAQRKLSLQRDHHGLAGRGNVPWTRWFPHL